MSEIKYSWNCSYTVVFFLIQIKAIILVKIGIIPLSWRGP